MIGLIVALGGCVLAVGNTESLLTRAGFKQIPADTPKRAEHLQTLAAVLEEQRQEERARADIP